MYKSGFVAIVGKPNAGKSTLINKLVGYKVAITTPKPQTTRYNIKGILTTSSSQIIFIDTPGVHMPKHKLGEYMMKGVSNAINEVDVIIYLVDATKYRIDGANEKIINDLVALNKKIILCVNKIDKVKKDELLTVINTYNEYIVGLGRSFAEIIPVSVYKDDGLDILVKNVEKYLPEGDQIYLDDEITDISEKEIVEETIREKLLNNLDEEVPHGINVQVESFKEVQEIINKEIVNKYDIQVNIICEKASHKGIIIGKSGEMLKKVRLQSKKEIEKMLETKVSLELWVKVRPDWQKKDIYLNNIKNKI
ncbi:MAG: GTPase Era [Clostridia bacterium]|nr:GTPase Era [Clostridia bacterium]